MQGAREGVGACYVLLVRCGARWCARLRATTAPAMAATRHGGGELRSSRGRQLRHGNGREKRGERWRSSPRIQRARGRGRGCPEAPESTTSTHGGRRRGWRRRWLHGVLRLAWLDEEVAGDEAELLGTTGRRGGGGGYGHGVRRRRQRFGRGERERCRGGRGTRERGRDPGRCWALLARPGRRGGGHAGSCRGAHARGVRRPRALSLWREEGDDWHRPVSWAELLGRSGKWPR